MRNVENCLKQSDLEVDKIVLNSVAKSQALLSQEDKNSGVCLLDIGAGVTGYSVYREEGIIQSGIIAMGADEVTQSIAYAFDTSLEEAKRLKENYGVAKTLSQSDDKFIDFIQANNKEERQLSSLDLSEVIEESYREIFEELKNELKHRNLDSIIKSGFVLCGGGSEIGSIEELVRDFFSKRVKLGKIQRSRISGLEAILTDYRSALAQRIPAMEELKLTGGWAGYYDCNRLDNNAVVGKHPKFENVYLATGFTGRGLMQAPGIGRALTELITTGAYQSIDISNMAVERVLGKEARPEPYVL